MTVFFLTDRSQGWSYTIYQCFQLSKVANHNITVSHSVSKTASANPGDHYLLWGFEILKKIILRVTHGLMLNMSLVVSGLATDGFLDLSKSSLQVICTSSLGLMAPLSIGVGETGLVGVGVAFLPWMSCTCKEWGRVQWGKISNSLLLL